MAMGLGIDYVVGFLWGVTVRLLEFCTRRIWLICTRFVVPRYARVCIEFIVKVMG